MNDLHDPNAARSPGDHLPRRRALGVGLGGLAALVAGCSSAASDAVVGDEGSPAPGPSGTGVGAHLLGTWMVTNTVHPDGDPKLDRRIEVTEDGWTMTILDPDGEVEEGGRWVETADGQVAVAAGDADRVLVTTSLAGGIEAQRERDGFGYVYGSSDWLAEVTVSAEIADDRITITHGGDADAWRRVFVATRT